MSIDTPLSSPTAPPDPPEQAGAARSAARRPIGRTIAMLVGVPILVLVLGYVAFSQFKPYIFSGTVLQSPSTAPSMDGLVFGDGSPVDIAAFEGDVVLIYFGYTHCPDVCPATLVKAANARDQLDGDADRVHVMMVSVDPQRDTPDAVGDYVGAFDASFLGVTGSREAVDRVTAQYGVFSARGEELGGGDYAVDHTATLMGIDTDGHLRILWPTDVAVDDLSSDLNELL